ncbi:hypothetical protein SAMN05216298_0306 [Glycomyces sambucus]|uniref:Uncharacterized protein n=1 Tax=Glycomyces sambucus TaxID=380244 RepID=A0A1G9CFC6_9ACTN|nr:hypothetical protein SAMN05216298_0306 [Glycomyces sambucus]
MASAAAAWVEVGERRVMIPHHDRILFPGEGVTRADLVAHFGSVAMAAGTVASPLADSSRTRLVRPGDLSPDLNAALWFRD